MNNQEKYAILYKAVGQTPLECVKNWQYSRPDLVNTPLAYAGRLDPMASGKLLILIGEECRHQENYHALDKQYRFQILFGVSSDSGDVLGLVSEGGNKTPSKKSIVEALVNFIGKIELPYPIFSSKTVKGKPLHTWTMEGRLDEIEIPTKKSVVYKLELVNYQILSRLEVFDYATSKIELIPKVTDVRKALGNDFRRPEIRQAWADFLSQGQVDNTFAVVTLDCLASSGTYMRTLAEIIAESLNSKGLAYSIDRLEIGVFNKETQSWQKTF